ncbi:choice-of-anchor Q domain-containing protein [Lysobacter soli]|uniref:Right-handed parallel beta-helix repeat-containing protein n=1 Tax=Lysobacter soli TaxID=453783 RepID=A0A3D8VED9_9GAMM|nr:choice-of-anchor Q domain-containing protein [Lysobacter soli]RDY67777.1 hypothetical protein DX912_07620 [Lysobacter soli]
MVRIGHFASFTITLIILMGVAVPTPAAYAAMRLVSNCSDSGTGSLRAAIGAAASGDVIDLRSLGCSAIVLTSGSIVVPQADLTIRGRTRYALTIDGNRKDRVFLHDGTGTLRIEYVSVANGRRIADQENQISEYGGCIRSEGNVALHQAWVHGCSAEAFGFIDGPLAWGGGISAMGNVEVTWSAVFDNSATENSFGGGIYAQGRVTLYHAQVYQNEGYIGGGVMAEGGASVTYSRIYRNHAGAIGGGLYVSSLTGLSDLIINKSTLSNNMVRDDWRGTLYGLGGGFAVGEGEPAGKHLIVDSTISNNRAHTNSAGYAQGRLDIYNSTIAYNAEVTNIYGGEGEDPLRPCDRRGALRADALHLESTIVARNSCVAGPVGYGISASTGSVVGAHNLIEYPLVPVPADTISLDPRLAPLADNGGYSATHLPLADSPVLGQGSNLFDRMYDQRGPGFPRVKGAAPDIGSTER